MRTLLVILLALVLYPAIRGFAQNGDKAQAAAPNAPAVVQQCAACHGARGEGNPAGGIPRIAGQSQYYLAKQLESYANGSRRNAVMQPIAKSFAPADREAAAAYYSQIDAPAAPRPANTTAPQSTERGRVLATVGDNALRVQACGNCHGPGGIGEAPMYPYLAGLDAAYIASALDEWKRGDRRNDAGRQMATVAEALRAEDIAAVAQYFASLSAPKPAPQNVVQAPPPKQPAPAAPATATVPANPAPGKAVGVEQGQSTTGGSQGPGGSGASVNPSGGRSRR
jgi:cytochrome c553